MRRMAKGFTIISPGELSELELRTRHLTYSALPICYKGAILYTYDTRNLNNTLMAGCTRIAQETPEVELDEVRLLYDFNQQLMKKFLIPVDKLDTLEEVLKTHPHYTKARKNQIKTEEKKLNKGDISEWLDALYVETFIKREWYTEIGRPRLIDPRTDAFKAKFIPVIKAIDRALYPATKRFNVKGVSTSDRPKIIELMFGDRELLSTDFTAYESSIKTPIMHAVEIPLIRYLVGHLLSDEDFAYIVSGLTSMQTLNTKGIRIMIDTLRQSGEISTATFNYYTNLVLTLFSYWRELYPDMTVAQFLDNLDEIIAKLEGDDGLHTSDRGMIKGTTYTKLGFIVKIIKEERCSLASFCGQVYNHETMTSFSDPIKFILKFGWVDVKYHSAGENTLWKLVKAKAMSYASQYRQCPIIYPVCYDLIQKLIKVKVDIKDLLVFTDPYKLELIGDMDNYEVPNIKPEDRLFFEKHYNIKSEDQVLIEKELSENDFSSPTIDRYVRTDYKENWEKNVKFCPQNYTEVDEVTELYKFKF